jgi:hypothetical protein
MMTRQLATVQRITDIQPIEGADKIEVATVLGWKVVIAKSEAHQIGDLVIYVEIDSLMPERPEYEFLRDKKFRVRTIKLRGQVSQGLILPLKIFGYYYDTLDLPDELKEGDDVTELLGIKKYDPEGEKEQRLLDEKLARENNKIKKFMMSNSFLRRVFRFFSPKRSYSFPSWIKKTDEERIQKLSKLFEQNKDTVYIATEKLDGQSATYFMIENPNFFSRWFGEKYLYGVCSRNFQLKKDNSNYWKISDKYSIKKVLQFLITGEKFVVLQGEIVGEGIQGNKYQISGLDFYAYNLIYTNGRTTHSNLELNTIPLGIKTVPVISKEFRLKDTIEDTLPLADGESMICKGVLREGLVVRNYSKDISFKIISNKFLLKVEKDEQKLEDK